MKKLIALFLVTLASNYSFAAPVSPQVEPLMGIFTAADGVHIQTRSGGCTAKESFVVDMEKAGGVTELTFLRVDGDVCLALLSYGVILDFSYADLGLKPGEKFIVRNPLAVSRAF